MRAKNRLQAVTMTSEGLLIFMLLDPHNLFEFAGGAGTAPVGSYVPLWRVQGRRGGCDGPRSQSTVKELQKR